MSPFRSPALKAALRPRRAALAGVAVVVAGAMTFSLAPSAGEQQRVKPARRVAAASTTSTTEAPATTATVAPTTTTEAPAPAPSAPSSAGVDEALVAGLQHVIAEHAAGLQVAVTVTRADGVAVMAHNAEAAVLPASTQKILTAAVALNELGGGFRYVTRAGVTSPVGADGTVSGDLVLVGSGDPALGGPDFGAIRTDRPRTPLEVIADGVVATGIRRVEGRVIGDASVFPHQPSAPGWLDAYVADGDAAVSSGLTVDAGRRVWHGSAGYESEPTTDPAGQAAAVLTTLLRQRGVHVANGPVATTTPVPVATVVGEVAGPPLSELLRHLMQASDNHFADAIFRTLGLHAGDASWHGSAAAVAAGLQRLGIETGDLNIADGSGLSRDNRVPANLLLSVDAAMFQTGHAPIWRELPAVAAASGTLKRRLIGTSADHRLRGKTGSLRDVNALAGSVYAGGSPRWRFAVIGNGLDPVGKRLVRDLQDAVVLALAEEAARCEATGCPPLG